VVDLLRVKPPGYSPLPPSKRLPMRTAQCAQVSPLAAQGVEGGGAEGAAYVRTEPGHVQAAGSRCVRGHPGCNAIVPLPRSIAGPGHLAVVAALPCSSGSADGLIDLTGCPPDLVKFASGTGGGTGGGGVSTAPAPAAISSDQSQASADDVESSCRGVHRGDPKAQAPIIRKVTRAHPV
jgi:hypothetical protein